MLSSIPKPFTTIPITTLQHPPLFPCRLTPIRSSDINNNDNNITSDDGGNSSPAAVTPPETVEIRFRRGARRRRKETGDGSGRTSKSQAQAAPPKKWEEMTLTEKAVELYMGEKGMLFWLNKFAYASIFIIIGGWILFRFVGPALNLYQLDTPPLAPSSIFKAS